MITVLCLSVTVPMEMVRVPGDMRHWDFALGRLITVGQSQAFGAPNARTGLSGRCGALTLLQTQIQTVRIRLWAPRPKQVSFIDEAEKFSVEVAATSEADWSHRRCQLRCTPKSDPRTHFHARASTYVSCQRAARSLTPFGWLVRHTKDE